MKSTRIEFIHCAGCMMILTSCGGKAQQSDSADDIEASDTSAEPDDTAVEEEVFDPCETEIEDHWEEIALAGLPALEAVGGYTNWNGIIIAHVSDGCYAAVNASCTHQGGEIFYSAIRNQFSCLVHAATFALDGEWVMGQVATDIQSYPVARRDNSLFILR